MDFIKLTHQQQTVFDSLMKWFESPGETYKSLVGYAGTGKTTMLAQLILYLIKNKRKVLVLTFTNKALDVCRSIYTKYCGVDRNLKYSTIHSYFSLKPTFEVHKQSILTLFSNESEVVLTADLVVVDECSQISDVLNILLRENRSLRTKVLYAGDAHQLPPISNEGDTADLMSVKTTDVFNHEPLYLTDIIRQEHSNPILDWYELVHDDLNSKCSTKALDALGKIKRGEVRYNNGSEGIFYISDFNRFKQLFIQDTLDLTDTMLASFKRNTARRWNQLIHDTLHGEPFAVNEPCLIYKRWTGSDVTLNNGELCRIDNRVVKRDFLENHMLNILELGFSNIEGMFKLISTSDDNNCASIQSFADDMFRYIRYADKPTRNKRFSTFYTKFDKYGVDKDMNLTVDYFTTSINKTIDYGYGCTTHKLQGTTLDNVYVALDDFKACKSTEMLIRLLYVAFSRARKRIVII
jgi:hypothetical protein